MDDLETIRASPKASSSSTTSMMTDNQIQNFLLLRDAATRNLQNLE
jgi:hypothetical protein